MRPLEEVPINGARSCNSLARVPRRDAQHAHGDWPVLIRGWIQDLAQTRMSTIAANNQTALDGGAVVEKRDGAVVKGVDCF